MSTAAVAAGAGGLAIEVHYNPAESWVDAQQAITPEELADIIDTCHRIHKIMNSER
jgi:3-deoxy-7-phosphoheptulonate synthase